jgi:glyoxylase-like metal-dependent hydrolase (beta-lactamase superfamily II)
MTYTGDVQPGGPAAVRELAHATIRKLAVSEMANNVYLLTCRGTGAQLLVDAAEDPDACLALVRAGGDRLDLVVTTHSHWDHHRALAQVVAATGARTAAGAEDADGLPVRPDRLLRHGDRIEVGALLLDVVHLRGHTPGSVALAYADPEGGTHLFTGDSLFPGGVGNTANPGQSFDSLIEDVTTRVFDVYDDDTWVYPGHGGDTTLGAERPHLQEWRDRGW